MSGTDSIDMLLSCANCGKGEEDSNKLKTCTACLSVKYCSRDCQIAHRKQHKKACKKRAAELYDEKLFADLPPRECPICFLPMPPEADQIMFKSCCAKVICIGCIYAMRMSEGKDICAFCRTPEANSDEENIKRLKILMEKDNAESFNMLAQQYAHGTHGMPQDRQKGCQLWRKAGELGCTKAYYNLGVAYDQGMGVEVDKKKAKHYYEQATMGGEITARHNLAGIEGRAGNHHRGMKHLIIATRAGSKESLNAVKMGFERGLVTKDEYASTLRAHHESQREMKSDQRDQAAEVIRLSEES